MSSLGIRIVIGSSIPSVIQSIGSAITETYRIQGIQYNSRAA